MHAFRLLGYVCVCVSLLCLLLSVMHIPRVISRTLKQLVYMFVCVCVNVCFFSVPVPSFIFPQPGSQSDPKHPIININFEASKETVLQKLKTETVSTNSSDGAVLLDIFFQILLSEFSVCRVDFI